MITATLAEMSECLTRRDFIIGACAGASLRPSSALATSPPASPSGLNVRQFGATADGLHNDTAAISSALKVSRTLFFPAGIYLVDRLLLPAGTTFLTEGPRTVFQQSSKLAATVRILTIVGSNVRIGDCTVRGNIATDTGEQHHGIFAAATAETGNLWNIRIGNVSGANLRGDVVYLGTSDGNSLRDVQVGDVDGSNILRNVVSVVGGRNIRIGRISGTRIGYTHLDIEPDQYNGPVIGCSVAAVHGGFVQVAGQTKDAYLDGISFGSLRLNYTRERSVPVYAPGLNRANAIELRNARSIKIRQLVVAGYAGAAIRQVWDPGELSDQYLNITKAYISDCCKNGGRTYIQGDRRATRLTIDRLQIGLRMPGVDVVRDCKSARVRVLVDKLGSRGRLVAQAADVIEPLAYAAAAIGAAATIVPLARRMWR